MDTIGNRYLAVGETIRLTCQQVGRDPQDVKLLVVTKRQPLEKIIELVDAGATRLGENYPEQAISKMDALKDHKQLEWHMIGHVQSRKIKFLPRYFMIHSIDSFSLAMKIDQVIERELPVCLEVNVAGETSKNGFLVADFKDWKGFRESVREFQKVSHIKLVGLMCMPPYVQNPEDNRLNFRKCKQLLDYLKEEDLNKELNELSMGTSADYMVAIEEGSTIVRIGEAIMGKRKSENISLESGER